jgi:hypothetical protein
MFPFLSYWTNFNCNWNIFTTRFKQCKLFWSGVSLVNWKILHFAVVNRWKSLSTITLTVPAKKNLPFQVHMSCNREKTMLLAHLSNFYQHRRYVKSKDDHQLLEALCPVSNDCEPFAQYPDPNNTRTSITKQVVLCGAIADSNIAVI